MPIILYGMQTCPPYRAVLMTAKALGIDVEVKNIKLDKKEHLSPEFLKLNPGHTVPVIDDNGFILPECFAILFYLINKYGKDDSLYPKDLQKRAHVDSRLSFSLTQLFPHLKQYIKEFLFPNKEPTKELLDNLDDDMNVVNTMLEGQTYFAGDHMTVADLSLLANVCTLEIFPPEIGNIVQKNANVVAWLNLMKKLPYYQCVNQQGLDELKKYGKE